MNDLYVISTLSNMHVGSGDANFGVIDNLIQRDVLNNHPNINSSGLKGAIREFFKDHYKNDEEIVTRIFGSSPKASQNKLTSGSFRFFEANLLSIPVRSNKTPFLMATCQGIIEEVLNKIKLFEIKSDEKEKLEEALNNLLKLNISSQKPVVFKNELNECVIEDSDLIAKLETNFSKENITIAEKLFGNLLVILDDNDFKDICDNEHLPVIARNNLEDGKSQNLWYEQVLPRFSRFYFVVMKADEDAQLFDTILNGKIIQIGANASIGYGFSTITSISTQLK